MRRRSGALHCQSEQDFMQLAEASQNYIGIFYDQKTNKKIMHQFKANQVASTERLKCEISNPEHSAQKIKQDYRGFQFGLEKDGERQEREELQRPNSETNQQQNIGIITSNVSKLLEKLQKHSILEMANENRYFDMVTEKNENKIIKYWIFNKQYNNNENILINLYLQRCQIIIEELGGLKIIKNESYEGAQSIIQRLENRLK